MSFNDQIEGLKRRILRHPQDYSAYYLIAQVYEYGLHDDGQAKSYYLQWFLRSNGFESADEAETLLKARIAAGQKHVELSLAELYCYLNRLDEAYECFLDASKWEREESDHFQFYFVGGTKAHRDRTRIRDYQEKSFQKVASTLSFKPSHRIEQYFYESVLHKGTLTGNQNPAHCDVASGVIHTVYNAHVKILGAHEICHSFISSVGQLPMFFNEGLACYVEHTLYNWPVHPAAIKLSEKGMLQRTELLLDDEYFRSCEKDVVYTQARSFIGFLVETYGMDSFLKLVSGHPRGKFEPVYSTGIDQCEKKWLEFLKAIPLARSPW